MPSLFFVTTEPILDRFDLGSCAPVFFLNRLIEEGFETQALCPFVSASGTNSRALMTIREQVKSLGLKKFEENGGKAVPMGGPGSVMVGVPFEDGNAFLEEINIDKLKVRPIVNYTIEGSKAHYLAPVMDGTLTNITYMQDRKMALIPFDYVMFYSHEKSLKHFVAMAKHIGKFTIVLADDKSLDAAQLKYCDVLLTESEELKTYYENLLPGRLIFNMGLFIDCNVRARPQGPIDVVYVGNDLKARHNFELIAAFLKANVQNLDIAFKVYSDLPAGNVGAVTYLPHPEACDDFLGSNTIVVNPPSDSAPLNRAAVLAMIHGNQVVGSKQSDIETIYKDYELATYLEDNSSVNAWGQAIVDCINKLRTEGEAKLRESANLGNFKPYDGKAVADIINSLRSYSFHPNRQRRKSHAH